MILSVFEFWQGTVFGCTSSVHRVTGNAYEVARSTYARF
jgi:hypothetical protein